MEYYKDGGAVALQEVRNFFSIDFNEFIVKRSCIDLSLKSKQAYIYSLQVDKIADPSVRVFVKTEIKYYLALDQDVRDIIKASREESQKAKTDLQE